MSCAKGTRQVRRGCGRDAEHRKVCTNEPTSQRNRKQPRVDERTLRHLWAAKVVVVVAVTVVVVAAVVGTVVVVVLVVYARTWRPVGLRTVLHVTGVR